MWKSSGQQGAAGLGGGSHRAASGAAPPGLRALGLLLVLLSLVLPLAPGRGLAQPQVEPAALVGVWRGYERTGEMVVWGEMILHANGRFQKAFAMGPARAFQSGDWQATGQWVRFVPTDYEPKVYLGVAQAPPPPETWTVHRFDGRVIDASVGYTVMHYERVQ